MEFNAKNTIASLTLLELPLNQAITEDTVKNNYRQLCLVYHPDASNKRYSDGERFKELGESYEYLKNNIDRINKQIATNFSFDQDYSNYYASKAQTTRDTVEGEETRRKAKEAKRKAMAEDLKSEGKKLADMTVKWFYLNFLQFCFYLYWGF